MFSIEVHIHYSHPFYFTDSAFVAALWHIFGTHRNEDRHPLQTLSNSPFAERGCVRSISRSAWRGRLFCGPFSSGTTPAVNLQHDSGRISTNVPH
jgi:hypothetical protein